MNGYSSEFKQGVAGISVEDEPTGILPPAGMPPHHTRSQMAADKMSVIGCRRLGDMCDIFHRCCVGYSCVDHQQWDPLRKGFCKTVMGTGKSELKK